METQHFIKNTSRGAARAATVSPDNDCPNLSKMANCRSVYDTPTGEYLFRPLLQDFHALKAVWQNRATNSKHSY
ncbi:hypothetical protein JRG66_08735 [Salinimicrobium tongyeongense]|uniref:Uncharacterized protein n=1 Tax=Salinimicrobium tongyeongense TaxID=2809707 RepID=A0ABY6NMI2_9FLAO|nr:hypothetical protein [Salinimicrobium tongyeongense]UZH54089.1 hypothetical protein JRG66_08735 [Salinimicrobium tongyeongense]